MALARRRAPSGGGRRCRNRGPSPVELVRGTGGGVSAGLVNGEQDRSNLVRERGVIALSREEAVWEFQWGRGKARS